MLQKFLVFRRCSNPKFLDLVKILNHIQDKHQDPELRRMSTEELIRRKYVSIPENLCSYKCRLCNRLFVGQSQQRVLQHQK